MSKGISKKDKIELVLRVHKKVYNRAYIEGAKEAVSILINLLNACEVWQGEEAIKIITGKRKLINKDQP